MMCVNDATVKNVACLVISFPVSQSELGIPENIGLPKPSI